MRHCDVHGKYCPFYPRSLETSYINSDGDKKYIVSWAKCNSKDCMAWRVTGVDQG